MRNIASMVLCVGLALAPIASWAAHQDFIVTTDRTIYNPGETAHVSFEYRIEPKVALLTPSSCTFSVTLEGANGIVPIPGVQPACAPTVECDDNPGRIVGDVDILLSSDLACGVYKVRVRTTYLLLTPEHPFGTAIGGPEAVIPIIVCQDTQCLL